MRIVRTITMYRETRMELEPNERVVGATWVVGEEEGGWHILLEIDEPDDAEGKDGSN